MVREFKLVRLVGGGRVPGVTAVKAWATGPSVCRAQGGLIVWLLSGGAVQNQVFVQKPLWSLLPANALFPQGQDSDLALF